MASPKTESRFGNDSAREVWRQFDLLDPNSLTRFTESYRDLATVSVTLPDTAVNTNRAWNAAMLKEFDKLGIRTNAIEAVGDHNDFQHERFVTLLGDLSFALKGENRTNLSTYSYAETFDGLLGNGTPHSLPAGWSVGLGETSVFRDRTNTPFNNGNFESVGIGPHILDLGNSEDRTLGIHLPTARDTAAIQFLADLDDGIQANVLELTFDVEAWDKLSAEIANDSEQVGFRVSAEFDLGNGFESAVDLGEVTLSDLVAPTEALLDGNVDGNRGTFSLLGGFPFTDAQAMRLVFEASDETTSPGWVYGIDNVNLSLAFNGDFDGDGVLTLEDINLLSIATRHAGLTRFDLTRDGIVDDEDIAFWAVNLFGTKLGDVNLDNTVDFFDFLLFAQNFGNEQPALWGDGDFDADGTVGFGDFLAFSRAYGAVIDQAQVASVPEPSGLLLMFLSLGLCSVLRTQRRKRS